MDSKVSINSPPNHQMTQHVRLLYNFIANKKKSSESLI
jgi:hypothetical protein